MDINIIFGSMSTICILVMWRGSLIDAAKISYYETKLKNRGVDISHIENLGFIGLFKL